MPWLWQGARVSTNRTATRSSPSVARTTDPLLTLPDKSGVLYVRLYQRIRALIMQGAWPPGMRIPSSRRLADDLGISRNTASLALDQLLADGWIETRSRAGTYVSSDITLLGQLGSMRGGPQPSPGGRPPVPFEMAYGAVDAFPFDRWAKLQSRVWSKFVPDLLYEGDLAGDPALRETIAQLVAPMRGITISANDVVIVSSTLAAFDLVAATLPAGSTVIVEDPGYKFVDAPFRARGCRVVAIPVDSQGLDVAAGREAEPRPALIVTTAAAQFPMGVPLSRSRRQELLAWAREAEAWIIDDGFDADARFDCSPPAPSLLTEDGSSDRVITVNSFSRTLFRSLRLGYLTAPAEMRQRILAARAAIDGFVPLPSQLVLREFIMDGPWSAHQRRCRELYQQRRKAMIAALTPYLGSLFEAELNPCGLHLVARPRSMTADLVADRLRSVGIACTTLRELSRRDSWPEGVLLGFAAFSPDVIAATRPALDSALRPLLDR